MGSPQKQNTSFFTKAPGSVAVSGGFPFSKNIFRKWLHLYKLFVYLHITLKKRQHVMAYREKYTITTTVSMACEDPTTCYNQEVLGKVFSELLLPEYEQEKFAVAVMNNKLELLGTKVLFIGLTSCVHVDKAILARYVLSFPGATRFAVAHNHPSGNTSPSNADVSLTEELRKVADLLGLKIVDHVIVANGAQPYSFSENGSQSVRYC